MTGKKSGMNSSKRVDGAGQSQPRWLAMGSLFTAGGVLVGLNALFILLVAFGNITDFETNQAFVHHVLSMDTANFGAPVGQGLDSAVMWHAVGSNPLQNAAYVGIIAWELLAGVALAAATVWWFAGSVRRRTRARALATIGLTMIVVLFVGGFLAVGGEWFQMWRSSDWNGSEAAFRSAVIALFALLVIHLPAATDAGTAAVDAHAGDG
jgi:predicted small integral membrane protein